MPKTHYTPQAIEALEQALAQAEKRADIAENSYKRVTEIAQIASNQVEGLLMVIGTLSLIVAGEVISSPDERYLGLTKRIAREVVQRVAAELIAERRQKADREGGES